MDPKDCILYSGAAAGAEATFGEAAERWGVEEINYSFKGHKDARTRGLTVLSDEDLLQGDVSLSYVARMMNRVYKDTPLFRRVLQSIWHQVNSGQQVFVIGWIKDDGTVKGGTGWGAEFAKLCNKPLYVFDQDKDDWFHWRDWTWESVEAPVIEHEKFTGTGTRLLEPNGEAAIDALFTRTFEK